MYGLRVVLGVIDVRCPELRGVRLAASRRFVMNSIFNRLLSALRLLGGSVMRGSTVYCGH